MELGRLARLSADKRRDFACLGGIARQRKAAADRKALIGLTLLDRQLPPIEWPPIEGDISDYIDRTWTLMVIRVWQECLDLARHSGDPAVMLRVLIPMTAMCPQLASRKTVTAGSTETPLPSNVDLSHLSMEDLSRITGGLRVHAGIAPITKQSGKHRMVQMRYAYKSRYLWHEDTEEPDEILVEPITKNPVKQYLANRNSRQPHRGSIDGEIN